MTNPSLENLDPSEREALLARARAAKLQRKGSTQRAPIEVRATPGGAWPLSFAQQRLWFIAQMGQDASVAYHIPGALALDGQLDDDALDAALDRIVQRHEALRTGFALVDGRAQQCIAPHGRFALERHDISADDPHARQAAIAHWSAHEAAAPFDLGRAPLIRARLLRLGQREHILLLTLHHIVSDGWSMGVLMRELGELYRAYADQGVAHWEDPLPPLPVQYADYTLWQRQWLDGAVQKQQLAYWRAQLAGAPELLTLPTDRPRPAVQDYSGRSIGFELDADLSAALKALAHKHGSTLYMTLLAAWSALCARLAGQDEVVIGSPVANRTRVELEPLIGFFVNTLSLRIDVSANPSVSELLAQVRETVLQAQSHQDVPFEQVVEALNPQRTLAHSPIFQLMFAWQNTPREALELGQIALRELEFDHHSAKFDLALDMQEADGRIVGRLGFATALFERATMERHAAYLKALLEGMVRDDSQPVASIPILGQAERRQVLVDWNATGRDYGDAFAHELFERRAAQAPDAIALEADGASLTYQALNEQANQLAHYLVSLGVRPDTRVAIALERGMPLVLAMLATLKAGGAYVPLDPHYPSDRLAFMLDDSRPKVVLTQASLQERLPACRALMTAAVLELDAAHAPWAIQPASNPKRTATALAPSHLAYVIYTSGSTGKPKGVMVEHRNLANLVGWHADAFPLMAGERASSTAGIAFDACTWEVWPPLCMGAALALAPAGASGDPLALLDWWERQQLHCSFLVTALADIAVQREAGAAKPLRTLLVGGDRLGKVPAAGLGFDLVNNYGPTEATVVATSGRIRAGDAVVHIGRPIANTSIYLLDRYGQPVPVGVTGEIHIGGASVARGYLNQPQLTQERFLPDPFAQIPHARMYRSGDLARWLADGTIEFLGRNDHQVKIRGLRIELGEIEAHLRRQNGVREALVLAREDSPGDRRLVAYLAGDVDTGAVREALARELPEYMVPAACVVLDAMPLTANGKLDRKALPAPEGAAYAQRSYQAPQGATETALAAIWAELLQRDRVGRHDHFFELGGHSLLAVQLMERMRRMHLGADIRTLFAQPTLAALAQAVEQAAGTGGGEVAVPPNAIPAGCNEITPAMLPLVTLDQRQIARIASAVPGGMPAIQDIYPLAPLQEGILFHHLLQAEGDPYLSSATLAFDSCARMEGFVAALQQVIDRHDVLRSAILWEGLSEPVQVVWRQARFVVDTPALPAGDTVAQLCALADPRHVRLDVRTAPLLRGFSAFDDRSGRWLLQLLLHHMILDHTTLDVMFQEIAAIQGGRAGELPEPVPFRNFVAQARLEGRAREHEAFFRQMLGDVDQATVPYGLADVKGDGSKVEEVQRRLTPVLSQRIRRQARAAGVSAASLFHWAWARVVAQGSGRDDVIFGTVLFGRMQGGAGADRAMGLFINTLPLRVRLGAASVQDELRAIHETLLQLVRHEHAPLSLAQRCSALPAGQPLFSALLNFRHSAGRDDQADGGWDEGIEVLSAQERTNYPFGLSVDDLGQDFLLTLQVAAPVEARQICDDVRRELEALADALDKNERTPVAAVNGAAPWSDAVRSFAQPFCIHEQFEQQVERTPHAIAVRHGDAELSYGHLNALANQLAHHLRALGVRPDDRVAICVQRDHSMLVAILAVLKAGGAYVPLDPAYPAARLAHMLHDSAPKVLITHEGTLQAVEHAVPVLDLSQSQPAWAHNATSNPRADEVGLRPHHMAYIIYTSGSTGLPKGVMVEHANVGRLFAATADWFGFGPDDVWTMFHSYAFDFSVWEMWGALLHGGRVVLVPQAIARSPDDFYRLVCEQGVTVLNQTPGAFRRFIASQEASEATHSLRYVVFGGEALQPAMLAPWYARNGERTRLVNMYGITETTVHVTYRALTPADAQGSGSPIGMPIPDLAVHILDTQGRPAPLGVVGEMHVGGAGVARGYLNRPELTAERFIDDPFQPGVGKRLYRSGDLGRRLRDGSIEFMGRNDAQVKVRGFRIELGEIEARLLHLPAVREAVVLAIDDAQGDKRLAAYVVPRDGAAQGDPMALRAALAQLLPDYMVPACIVCLDSLPLTAHGKLDRAALPAPDAARSQAGYTAPRNAAEECIASIWADVLGIDKVGVHDNFFALGGDSMRTIAIVSKARERGIALSIEHIFSHLSVAGVAAALARAQPDAAALATTPAAPAAMALSPADAALLPGDVEDAYELTCLQLGMVFHNQMSADGSVYHDVFSHHLRIAAWHAGTFQQALDAVVARHPVLRTSFDLRTYSVPLQLVHRDARIVADISDISAFDAARQESLIGDWLRRERANGFAPGQAPMLRIFLHRRGDDSVQLTLSFHHAILDGWSVASFVTELFQAYRALQAGGRIDAPALACSFRQAVAAEQAILGSSSAAAFWSDYLAGHTVASLPPRDADQDPGASRTAAVTLPEGVTARLDALARELHVPLRTLLLAAHVRVMALFSGESDVLTGMVSHARPAEQDGDKVLGLYLNTLPLRQAIAPGSWKDLIVATFKSELAVMPYRAYPYARIMQENGRRALFDTAFNFVNFYVYDGLRNVQSLEFLEGQAFEATNHALTFNAAQEGDRLTLSLQRDPARLSARQGARIAAAYQAALVTMAREPDADHVLAGLLDAAEREQVLRGWNDTARDYRLDLCIHELIEAQVRRSPLAVALEAGGTRLSYAALNQEANRLAAHLRMLGVGPERRVALCLERGVAMVVGLLAVLKAGGAYVPLDPAYPPERLAFMLDDCAPLVLLTDAGLARRLSVAPELHVLLLDAVNPPWQALAGSDVAAAGLSPASLAYVIYTSGSTGQPKGVMNEHLGVVNRLLWMQEAYRLDAADAVLQKTPYSFDVSVWEFFWPLMSGARLVMARPDGHKDPAYLADAIERHGITTVHFVPSMLQAFVDNGAAARCTGLTRVVCSGEALPGALARRMRQCLPGAQLYNLYGPTEAAVDVTAWHCAGPDLPDSIPLGRPIGNTAIYLLDRYGQPAPIGVPGEIHIGGVQVARGYQNREELTRERFVPDPFAGKPGARMYKTGDLGRWLADGSVEFLGRNDHQVKIRGLRIELGDIEAHLARQEGVREAVVLAREDSPGDKRLVAYLVGQVDTQSVRAALARELPEYMVPAACVVLDALPLSANGKLDRKALPAPEGSAYARRTWEAPQGPTETALAGMWAALLKVERVGRNDHFFELGGHSLLAVQLMERMRRQELFADIRTLFSQPTLAALAQAVDQAGQAGRRDVVVPPNGIPPGCTDITPAMLPLVALDAEQIARIVASVPGGAANVQDIYPLAPLQEGILFHHLLQNKGDAYLLSATLSFDARERLDAFTGALQQVLTRHDALRTALLWEGLPEPVQVVWREATFTVDTPVLPGVDTPAELRAHADPRHFRIDLRRAPLMHGFAAFDDKTGCWLLQLLLHHVVTDHTTLDVLFEEMALIQAGRAQDLPLPVPFRNFVAQARLGVSVQEHEQFFRRMLGDVDQPTAPFGLLDMQGDGSNVDEARLPLDPALALRLREHARRLGVSATSLFHLAWAQVLARTSGRDDVVFGTALFGRMHGGSGADRVLGLFMNTLPVRIRLDDTPLEAAVRDTHERLAQLLHHEHAPLSLAQRCSGMAASVPLFSAGFNYRHSPPAQQVWEGMEVLHGEELSNFPLVLKVDDHGAAFSLTANAQRPIDPMRVCRYMHTALDHLADALDNAPATTSCQLDILPAGERRQLLDGWNGAIVALDAGRCIHQLFEQHAASSPDAAALVVDGSAPLSYAELNARANRLAHHLIKSGLRPDMRVAIALPRGADMIVALLATLKAGAAYVPLDPGYPAERLAFMLDDSRPRVVLTHADLQERLPASRALLTATVLELDDPAAPWQDKPATNPDPAALGLTDAHLAYVIYTSGSTGTPKGVMMEHAALCNLAQAQIDSFGVTARSRILQFASFSFDGCIFEVVMALCHGAALYMVASEVPLAGDDLLAVADRHGISHAILPPAVLTALPDDARMDSVTTLVMAGEAPGRALVRRWAAGRTLINGYGPTETAVCATVFVCDAQDAGEPPIGQPIGNKRIYLLDAHGAPVPLGVAGEIHIGGAGIARGYLNRRELSEERFVPDPFAGTAGARMYRSGDLGRRRADGNIEFVGRVDQQVKVRGFRIELGEIDTVLQSAPGVRDCVVLAREDQPGQRRLVAYFSTPEPELCTPESLRLHLAGRLPEYMVPAAYVCLDALPLTPNGKLDRRALPAPEDGAFGTRAYEAPQGPVEAALAALWSELLQVERVGRRDHFFELGGHSLLAVQMISHLRQRLGLEAALSDLFAQPLLHAFAALAHKAPAQGLPPLAAGPRPRDIPVSFAQQRLWFIAQMGEAASAAYHISGGMRLHGRLDERALRCALDRIVQRHEALRTHFALVDGAPVQRIAASTGLRLVRHDLSAEAQPQALVDHWSRVEAGSPLDLGHGPLIRARLLRLGEQEHVLLLTLHHVVSDGWSMGVLARELSALYSAYAVDGLAPGLDPLPPLPVQYADYALWQRGWLSAAPAREQLDYWKRQLAGAPALITLPSDRPRPALQDYTGRSLPFAIDAALCTGLKALSRRHGTTLYMTLLAAWAALAARLAGQDDVVIGSPVANRGRVELEPMIGFFVNTVALRLDLSDSPTVAGLLAQARQRVLEAQSNQDVPFEQVVEVLNPERALNYSSIFQLMFAWQNMPHEAVQLGELRLEELPERTDRSTAFDLSLTLQESGERIVGTMEYAAALYDRATIERHLARLRTVLQGMVRDDSQAFDRIDLLDADERRQLEAAWRRLRQPYPDNACIHQLFEQQVERTPHATAAEQEGRAVSYSELNARANQLAHHLRQRGVQPDQRVAICAPRSLEMLAAILGVLKSGAAYVPLDPAYPQERIDYMLRDSAPVALLTQDDLEAPSWQHQPTANPEPAAIGLDPSHLAYVIYTSGSTGAPKGVMIEHRGLCNQIAALGRLYGLGPADRVLQFAAPSFDMSVEEIFGALLGGATLVLGSPAWIADARRWCELAEANALTVANLPTMFWQQIAQAPHVALPPTLRQISIGGEGVAAAALDAWWARPGHRPLLVNAYGPTEATINATILACQPGANPRSIGSPVANTPVYLLDRHGQPVPPGVAGEIHIGGVGVARGYLNLPQLTRERFVPDPFAGEAGARMYRSGDLGRWLADGSLEYLGRNDHQVKLRGFRIELGEIEAQLARQGGVRQAVVLAREDAPGDKRLVAYVAGEADASLLRTALAQALPDYMVPAAFVMLAAMPLTPNGKLDRRALPPPDGSAYAQRAYAAPQGETETALARIWAELLHVERVGRDDNFFELGGHSLLAVQLMERMRRRQMPVDIRTLFLRPTVAALAGATGAEPAREVVVPPNRIPSGCTAITPDMLPLVALDAAQIARITDTVAGGAANVQDIYPLAPLQEGILFHHLLQAEGDLYLSSATLAFDSRERLDGFVRALGQVIARHDALRTSVQWEGLPEPVQVVWRDAPFVLETPTLAAGDVAAMLRAHADPRSMRIDLGQAPLLRGVAAPDPDHGRWLLLLLEHHLVTDHTTLDLLFEEMAMIDAGRAGELAAPVPFRNFVAQARLGVSRQEHEAFFRTMLGDVDAPTAPFGLSNVQGDGSTVHEARQVLAPALSDRIRRQARALGVSAASLFHWAWAQVLAHATGREDVVFGTVLFGRMQPGAGAERSMGLFINTLPLRVRLGEVSVEQGIRQTHALLAQLMRHEHAPLALAQRSSALTAGTPLFSALLNYRHSGQPASDSVTGPWAQGITVLAAEERSNYPFCLSVDDLGDGFGLSAQVAEPVDPQRVCGYVAQALEGLVVALETAPQQPARDIAILGADERERLLVRWNDTAQAFPDELCIHQLFERQAARAPQAPALVQHDQRLDYAQLNERANRLAHHLRSLGVQPDARVAICAPRSVEMVVAILAVLKAGAAYVPLDPAYPRERLGYMLRDSAPLALLTMAGMPLPADVQVPVLELDGQSQPWLEQPAANPDPAALGLTPASLAYVIYTSGSTGQPKGVMVEHRGLCNVAQAQARALGVDPASRVLQCASPGFDACVFELLMALCHGAALYLPAPGALLAGPVLGEALAAHGITHVTLTPAVLNGLDAGAGLAALRTLVVAGEACSQALVERWAPGRVFVNAYGPTETTIWATFQQCVAGAQAGAPPIGRPIANTAIYLLDRHGQPVPTGVAGEICIGGVGVARGYLHLPQLSAERFVPDPFAGRAGARMYRSGDLGRWSAGGTLDYLGRNDHQVKLRGLRIELGEIEAQLRRQDGVRDAIVLAREDRPGDRRLVAYVVAGAATLDAQRVRAALAQVLPEFMVPAAIVVLDALPLTPNGKLDRQALPAPEGAAYARTAFAPPQGDVETALARIWSELLGVDAVGREDDFFALGGHSLLTIQMVERLRQQGLQVEMRSIFDSPALKEIAARIRRSAALSHHLVPLRLGGARRPLFFLHEPTGEVLSYERLSRHFGDDMPIYGVQAGHVDAGQPVRMETLARRYLDVIRTVQPHGPYRLAGWSGGGLIAYEMAHQLLGEDESVEFLGLIDSGRPGYKAAEAMPDEAAMRWVFLEVYASYLDTSLDMLRVRDLQASGSIEAAVATCRERGWLPAAFTTEELSWRSARFAQLIQACANYVPQPLPISVHLFAGEPADGADPSIGWHALLRRHLHLNVIGGDHKTIMEEPYIETLAARIKRVLADAEALPALAAVAPDKAAITLQSGRKGHSPVFCVPGAGANVTAFLPLVHALGDAEPVIGLQARGHDGSCVPHATVEAAARAYLPEVRAHAGSGPYRLLGHSFGGWIALELARLLVQAGETVAQVVLVDCEPPGPVRHSDRLQTLTLFIDLLELDRGQALGVDRARLAGLDEAGQLAYLMERLSAAGVLPPRTPVDKLQGLLRVFGSHLNTSYQPAAPYAGSLLLVNADVAETAGSARRAAMSAPEKLARWQHLAERVEVQMLDGSNHMNILKQPFVDLLAGAAADAWAADADVMPLNPFIHSSSKAKRQ
ncbi:non-ribosomal peptide synthase/polyketide synthase [Massilia atriviolacea]|uniref:Amino acid adenylation domain-containing protein n=1 Tax=Massilia atriviolacea TaxID=2495579 RepID=A0A430HS60_9BURK|nr:non-ribosomal peptide synthase/polyketide synthase [Massilia atriviolacea]RSZ60356.1 amino acid adenylation domain-containing protein [Massilia atriviolacea]